MSGKLDKKMRRMVRAQAQAKGLRLMVKARQIILRWRLMVVVVALLVPANVWAIVELVRKVVNG